MRIFQSFADPISRAAVPLFYGLIRRRLLFGGAAQCEARLNGINLNYYYQGPPPTAKAPAPLPILLIHGLADNALTWSLVITLLARTHPVYAIDLPGYGLSAAPAGRAFATLEETCDLIAVFVREIIGRPALVVGNSMGAWLAVKQAWATPALVRGIVLVNAGGAALAGRPSWATFEELIGVRDLRAARTIFQQIFGVIPAPLLYLGQRGLQEVFQRPVVRAFVANVQEREFLHPHDLRHLPAPAALIWGDSDRFLPAGSFDFFHENMPSAPLLLLRPCGHLPQRERPLAVSRFIRRFAVQLSASKPIDVSTQATAGTQQ